MSYAHQVTAGTGVNSYSPLMPGTPDPTFDDWFNLRPNFAQATIHIGNTRLLGLGAGPALAPGSVLTADDIPDIDPGLADYEQANGPIDLEGPTVSVTALPFGSNILQGANLTVTVNATDNVGLAPVTVSFDIDGSGAIDATGESVIATSTGPDQFEATFLNLVGPDGVREIVATVSDTSSNAGKDTQPIVVPEPSLISGLASTIALLTALNRLRGRRRSQPSIKG